MQSTTCKYVHAAVSRVCMWTAGLGIALAVAGADGATLSPADAPFVSATLVEAITTDLSHGRMAEAADRIDGLLASYPTGLIQTPGGAISTAAWARSLITAHPDLVPALATRTGDRPRHALRDALERGDVQPEAIYRITERFPRSPAEGHILLAAAQRALELGDTVAAADLIARARASNTDVTMPSWVDSLETARAAAGSALPFAAGWYTAPEALMTPKFLPVHSGGMLFIASPGGLVAVSDTGELVWKHQSAVPRDRLPLGIRGRGLVFQPAVLADAKNGPQVVVARQGTADGDGLLLRAFDARDGRVLWSSDQQGPTREMNMIGAPAVAGRFVYLVALGESPRGQSMDLLALDVMDGSLRWRCPIGAITDEPILRGRRRQSEPAFDPQPFWQQSAPAVGGDTIVLAPADGSVIAIDRFTGSVRWRTKYETEAPVTSDAWRKYREQRVRGAQPRPPVKSQQLVRYMAAPMVTDGVVVVAPLDAPTVMGFDLAGGRLLWSQVQEQAPILIGAARGTAIVVGSQVVAIEAHTGGQRWQYAPPGAFAITGPGAVVGDALHLPVANRMVTLEAATGAAIQAPPLPPVQRIVAIEAVRRALADIGAGFTAVEAPPEE